MEKLKNVTGNTLRDLMAADICVLEEDTFTRVCMQFVDCISIIR